MLGFPFVVLRSRLAGLRTGSVERQILDHRPLHALLHPRKRYPRRGCVGGHYCRHGLLRGEAVVERGIKTGVDPAAPACIDEAVHQAGERMLGIVSRLGRQWHRLPRRF